MKTRRDFKYTRAAGTRDGDGTGAWQAPWQDDGEHSSAVHRHVAMQTHGT